MKKATLLLGSLLVVGATATAKEVAPAPVVQQEPQIVEVVVIKEAPKVWKPNGSIGQELEYFGNQEHQSDKDYLRYRPVQGSINLTEKVSADFRSRFRIGLHEKADLTSRGDFRTRWYYKHGLLGDTKIDMKSRLRFEKSSKFQAGVNYDATNFEASSLGLDYILEYNLGFNFANYFPSNEYFKVTNFSVTPSYSYMFADGTGEYANTLGIDLFTTYDLAWGFSAELNVYGFGTWASMDRAVGTADNYKLVNNYGTVAVEAYLYYNYTLLQSEDGRANLKFLFEGGYDPYAWSSERIYGLENAGGTLVGNGQKTDYTLYAMPELRVNYKITPDVNLYAAAKAYYGNNVTLGNKASDWKWQPRAVVGWSTKF